MKSIVNTASFYIDNKLVAQTQKIIYIRRNKPMSCNCNCTCPRDFGLIKSGIPTANGNLVIPLSICTDELRQGDTFEFVIPCNFNYPDCSGNVQLLINNLITLTGLRYGVVKADQICKRTKYRVIVGTEFSTATFVNKLNCSKFTYPVLEAVTTINVTPDTPVAPISETISKVSK